ncbi:MAG: GNAT family N-acetyltransferase [candidate division Zixibacteria bacterium HGW-Zixibacteria-1]|nr:MAG: GNAT family N-acetyltransferase [candidate division Zixibacteria bacterium HGW-Zixibacteria-1]
MPYKLKKMTNADRMAVMKIFNHFVENSFAAYNDTRVSDGIFDHFLNISKGYLALTVRTETDQVVGFAMMRPFHPANSFRKTLEVGYFIMPEHTGQGLGSQILERFIKKAKALGVEILLASISSLNEKSIRFHLKHGFVECGRFKGIGIKKGQKFDMVWMQKNL